MKKLLVIILTVTILLTVTACDKKSESTVKGASSSPADASTQEPSSKDTEQEKITQKDPPKAEEKPKETVKVEEKTEELTKIEEKPEETTKIEEKPEEVVKAEKKQVPGTEEKPTPVQEPLTFTYSETEGEEVWFPGQYFDMEVESDYISKYTVPKITCNDSSLQMEIDSYIDKSCREYYAEQFRLIHKIHESGNKDYMDVGFNILQFTPKHYEDKGMFVVGGDELIAKYRTGFGYNSKRFVIALDKETGKILQGIDMVEKLKLDPKMIVQRIQDELDTYTNFIPIMPEDLGQVEEKIIPKVKNPEEPAIYLLKHDISVDTLKDLDFGIFDGHIIVTMPFLNLHMESYNGRENGIYHVQISTKME